MPRKDAILPRMSDPVRNDLEASPDEMRFSLWGIDIGIAMVTALLAFIVTHFGETQRFLGLLERAEPRWLLAAAALQASTYFCAGAV